MLAGIMKANNPKVLYMHASIMKKDQRIVSICSLRNHDIPMFAVLCKRFFSKAIGLCMYNRKTNSVQGATNL